MNYTQTIPRKKYVTLQNMNTSKHCKNGQNSSAVSLNFTNIRNTLKFILHII